MSTVTEQTPAQARNTFAYDATIQYNTIQYMSPYVPLHRYCILKFVSILPGQNVISRIIAEGVGKLPLSPLSLSVRIIESPLVNLTNNSIRKVVKRFNQCIIQAHERNEVKNVVQKQRRSFKDWLQKYFFEGLLFCRIYR